MYLAMVPSDSKLLGNEMIQQSAFCDVTRRVLPMICWNTTVL